MSSVRQRNDEARRASGPVYVSHSAPKADGTVEWFIVQVQGPPTDDPIELGERYSREIRSLRDVGRAVVVISYFPELYAKVI
jgi:hypothetical protein